jgi:hypothetical protein
MSIYTHPSIYLQLPSVYSIHLSTNLSTVTSIYGIHLHVIPPIYCIHVSALSIYVYLQCSNYLSKAFIYPWYPSVYLTHVELPSVYNIHVSPRRSTASSIYGTHLPKILLQYLQYTFNKII